MTFQNLFRRRKILSKPFNSHMVCCIVNFLKNFGISGRSYNLSQNTLRLINKFESLIGDFTHFSGTIAKFLFLQERLGTRLCVDSISSFD